MEPGGEFLISGGPLAVPARELPMLLPGPASLELTFQRDFIGRNAFIALSHQPGVM